MANRETYPASLSPLTGDISGPAGAQQVTVVGLQTVPVDSITPVQQANLVYDYNVGKWMVRVPGNMSVLLNGTPDSIGNLQAFTAISDDYDFTVNNISLSMLVGWALGFNFSVYVNGTGVA